MPCGEVTVNAYCIGRGSPSISEGAGLGELADPLWSVDAVCIGARRGGIWSRSLTLLRQFELTDRSFGPNLDHDRPRTDIGTSAFIEIAKADLSAPRLYHKVNP